MPLKHFCRAKEAEILALRDLEAGNALPAPFKGPRPSFVAALRQAKQDTVLPVIAEYKRASPSCGPINTTLGPEEAALAYRDGGAACISVLTEEHYFGGSTDFVPRMAALPRMPPLLRKDFILDPLQVRATAASPASALLLMVRLTPDVTRLRALHQLAHSLGLEAVVEVFDRQELQLAREIGATLIQVNARDLASLCVDRPCALQWAQEERKREGQGAQELWIAASGIEHSGHLREAAQAGFDAALVGSSLMRQDAPGTALQLLLQGEDRCRRS